MTAFDRALLVALLSIGLAASASSQEAKQGQPPAPDAPRTLTGKERLGPKWTDEQQIDNCKVPLDKRGTRPRPSACSQAATGS